MTTTAHDLFGFDATREARDEATLDAMIAAYEEIDRDPSSPALAWLARMLGRASVAADVLGMRFAERLDRLAALVEDVAMR